MKSMEKKFLSITAWFVLLKPNSLLILRYWSVVPGMTVNLTASDNLFTEATGNGVILKIYEDSTYFYIVTTLPFATLPAWSNKKILLFRNSGAKFIRCTGSDPIRAASIAFDKGLEYWEYKRYILGAHFADNLHFKNEIYGSLSQITVTPIQLGSEDGAYINLTFNTFNSASDFVRDSGGTVVRIVVGAGGQRIITHNTFTGAQRGDAITVGGEASAYLPINRVVNSEFFVDAGGYAADNYRAPVIMIELWLDCEIARKVIPVNFDSSTPPRPVMATAGRLP